MSNSKSNQNDANETYSFSSEASDLAAPVQVCLKANQYQMMHYLAGGSTCSVYLIKDDASGRLLAAKVIDHSKVQPKFLHDLLPNELKIVRILNHPNVLKTESVLQIPNYSIIVSEYAQEGDLLQLLQKCDQINMVTHRRYFTDCTKGLAYLHSIGIGHRDVKADNVLLFTGGETKLADFGYAVFLQDDNGQIKAFQQFCGTPEYAAPEILYHFPYSPAISDCFSLGCLLYLLSTRSLPFGYGAAIRTKTGITAQFERIVKRQWVVQGEIERDNNLKELIDHLLSPNPRTRFTAKQVLAHIWIRDSQNA